MSCIIYQWRYLYLHSSIFRLAYIVFSISVTHNLFQPVTHNQGCMYQTFLFLLFFAWNSHQIPVWLDSLPSDFWSNAIWLEMLRIFWLLLSQDGVHRYTSVEHTYSHCYSSVLKHTYMHRNPLSNEVDHQWMFNQKSYMKIYIFLNIFYQLNFNLNIFFGY